MTGAAWRFSTRADGDFHIGGEAHELATRRRALMDGPWTWLRQVHGTDVVVVDAPGAGAGAVADAAVTDRPGAVLAVHAADCLPILLRAPGVVGAAHAGWRGLVGGVVEATVAAMAALGAERIHAHLGPHIRTRCYEFGQDDLALVADRYGDEVQGTTGWDTPGLDLQAGARAALARCPEVLEVTVEPGCTACEPERYFSHRARADAGRHASAVMLVP